MTIVRARIRPFRVFAYGSLAFPDIATRLLGRVPRLAPALLEGYRRVPLRGLPFPAVVAERSATCTGHVIDVNARELRRIDHYEDDYYCRRRVWIMTGGQRRRAYLYVLRPAARHRVGAGLWSPARYSAAGMARARGDAGYCRRHVCS